MIAVLACGLGRSEDVWVVSNLCVRHFDPAVALSAGRAAGLSLCLTVEETAVDGLQDSRKRHSALNGEKKCSDALHVCDVEKGW